MHLLSDKLYEGTVHQSQQQLQKSLQTKAAAAATAFAAELQKPKSTITSSNKNATSIFHKSSKLASKRNSIDSHSVNGRSPDSSEDDELLTTLKHNDAKNASTATALHHRRSLSENVIMFPPHTTPSDKARCHMLNRQSSRAAITEESCQSPPSPLPLTPGAESDEYPPLMPANVSLRKVAETMFLKDPQYKPRLGEQPASKSNPFTTLAQLRGVKKMLGANPSTYTAGVGDLFSSCFETSSPFLRDLSVFQKMNANNKSSTTATTAGEPKSLPSSPTAMRRDYKIDKMLEDKVLKSVILAKNNMIDGFVRNNNADYESSDDSGCGGGGSGRDGGLRGGDEGEGVGMESGSGANANGNCEDDNDGTMKKLKVNSLFSHPLFKNGGKDDDVVSSDSDDAFEMRSAAAAAAATTTTNETVGDKHDEYPNILNRRGSSESGFFSSLNEDFTSSRPCACGGDRPKVNLESVVKMCRCCCIYSAPADASAAAFRLDDCSTTSAIGSMRSLDDDIDLSTDSIRANRYQAAIDIDTRSIDMGLINRLALDSEISTLLQRNHFANQLLYCKNRTSSIYTDSSDDISSLAGSDSLLWDDPRSNASSYASFPNARSAQIAKIVEYFERKVQSFKPFTTASTSATSAAVAAAAASATVASRHFSGAMSTTTTSQFNGSDCTEFRSEYPFGGTNRKFIDYKSRATAAEYEAFCLELDKRPVAPQRIMVCEGAVKSKLQIFDKLTVKQGAAAAAQQRE